jgi:hydroxyacylglutathione hydrolase
MKRWITKNGIEIFQVLKLGSNSYLIHKDNGNILVDAGTGLAYPRLRKNINALNLKSKHIDSLILTHTHYDHCQNAFAIQEQENCKILTGEKEVKYSKEGFTPLPGGTSSFTRIISGLGKRIGKKRLGYKPFFAEIQSDQESQALKDKFNSKIVVTDGHSPGSISVIVDDEIALVGDAMIGVFNKSIFPPFADDTEAMIKSWGKLLETNCIIFLPGHGREIKRDRLQRGYEKYARKFNIT